MHPEREVTTMETKRDEELVRIGLDPDTRNDWFGLRYAYEFNQRGDTETAKTFLKPKLHYKDIVKKNNTNDFEHIMILSDMEKIEAYDAIVDEFNNAWPDILENLDFKRVKQYYDQIESLFEK